MTDSEKLDMIINSLQGIKQDNEIMKEDIKELKSSVTNIKITLENDISPRLQNIESCYTSTYDRYRTGVEEHESMKSDIEVLKKVVTEHSEKLQQLA